MSAYITATGTFLPGYPIPNDEIEDYIGKAGRASSDLKDLILAKHKLRILNTHRGAKAPTSL